MWWKSGHSCLLLSHRSRFFHAAQSASVTLQERATHRLQAEPSVRACARARVCGFNCVTLNALTRRGAFSSTEFRRCVKWSRSLNG